MRHNTPRRSLNAAIGFAVVALLAWVPVASASSTASSDEAEVTVTGSPGSDQVTLTLVPNPVPDPDAPAILKVQDPTGVSPGAFCAAESPSSVNCQVQSGALVSGGAGNDTIAFSNAAGETVLEFVRLYGLDGNDTISGSSGTDFVYGGPGNDRIDAGPGRDYIECGEGSDGVVQDADDLEVNECETFITVSGGGGSGSGGGAGGIASAATIRGGRSAGTARVSSKGSFTLKRQVVECPAGGAACKVTTAVTGRVSASAKKKKNVKLGGSSYTLAAGKKGVVRLKLTKKGLRLLRRAKKVRGSVSIRVRKGSTLTTKKVSVTLRAPKKR